jgi:tRNA(Ser,Leu) C12 N-acetylase TAN1
LKKQSQIPRIFRNQNLISRNLGYDEIYLLNANNEIRTALTNINKKIEKIFDQLLEEDDGKTLRELQSKHAILKEKIATIKRMARGTGYNDNSKILQNFIKDNYSKEYSIIVPKKLINNHDSGLILNTTKTDDLTERIIKEIKEKINK